MSPELNLFPLWCTIDVGGLCLALSFLLLPQGLQKAGWIWWGFTQTSQGCLWWAALNPLICQEGESPFTQNVETPWEAWTCIILWTTGSPNTCEDGPKKLSRSNKKSLILMRADWKAVSAKKKPKLLVINRGKMYNFCHVFMSKPSPFFRRKLWG